MLLVGFFQYHRLIQLNWELVEEGFLCNQQLEFYITFLFLSDLDAHTTHIREDIASLLLVKIFDKHFKFLVIMFLGHLSLAECSIFILCNLVFDHCYNVLRTLD